MLSVHSNIHEKQSFLNWSSSENPGFWSTTFCVAENDYQPVVRDSPITIGVKNGQRVCQLCRIFEDQIGDVIDEETKAKQDDSLTTSTSIKYTRFSELDSLSQQGCLTCDTFRSAILYHHPSKNSYELLMHDDESIMVSPRVKDGTITGVTVSYPYKHSMEDFTNYDPEWPMGRPDPEIARILGHMASGPRQRYRRISTATVDLPLGPKRPTRISHRLEVEDQQLLANTHTEYSNPEMEIWYSNQCDVLYQQLHPWVVEGDNGEVQAARMENAKALRSLDDGQDGEFISNGRLIPMRDAISPRAHHVMSLFKLMGWLSECLSTHPGCGISTSNLVMPKRVLDLGSAPDLSKVRIKETDGTPIVYACLSYCWGVSSNNRCQLLKSNLEKFQEAIDFQELPSTIRDAVQIAKLLGIRYLWIDVLCIVQDDNLDWRDQSPKMGDIYGNALMTIAATSSEHADCGLLGVRIAECYNSEPCELLGRELRRPLPRIERFLVGAPIFQRAWTTQELYLSRRILHVTDGFLAWECRELHCTEFFPYGFPDHSDPTKAAHGVFPNFFAKELFRSEDTSADVAYDAWQDLVRDYSSKSMTKEEDILVAVSGLAGSVARKTGDIYLAGLWKKNLLQDLLWSSNESRDRSKVYTAPTWSWASTQYGSSYKDRDTRQSSLDFPKINDTAQTVVRIDAVDVTYLDNNKQSQALSGKLQLTGKLSKLEFFLEGVWASSSGSDLYVSAPDFNAVGDPLFDTADMIRSDRRHAIYRNRTTNTQLYCLAITREDAEPDYRDKHWMVQDLDEDLKHPQKAQERFDDFSKFHLEKKKKRSYERRSRRRFSMSDFSDPDLELWDTSPVELSRMKAYGSRLARVQELKDDDMAGCDGELGDGNEDFEDDMGTFSPPVPGHVSSTNENELNPENPADDIEISNPQDSHENETTEPPTAAAATAAAAEEPLSHDYLWQQSQKLVENMETKYEKSLQAQKERQLAYDAASITSSARTMHDWGNVPRRTSSLDRDGFRRWSRRFKKVHRAPTNAAERAEERRKELRCYLQGLMLERVDGVGGGGGGGGGVDGKSVNDGGSEENVYRRVGVAKLEIRGGETKAFEDVPDISVTII